MNNENFDTIKSIIDLIVSIKSNIDYKFGLCCYENKCKTDAKELQSMYYILLYMKDVINRNILKLLVFKSKKELLIFFYFNDNVFLSKTIKINKGNILNQQDLKNFITSLKNNVNEI